MIKEKQKTWCWLQFPHLPSSLSLPDFFSSSSPLLSASFPFTDVFSPSTKQLQKQMIEARDYYIPECKAVQSGYEHLRWSDCSRACYLLSSCFDPADEASTILQIYLILPATLGPGAYSASNRNEYQKHKNNNVSGE
jgi:hypothetical protein